MRSPGSIARRSSAWAAVLSVVLAGTLASAPFAAAVPLAAGPKMVEFAAGGDNPVDVVAGPDGSVWVALYIDKKVVKLDRSGHVLLTVPLGGSPSRIASDRRGGVWAAEPAANRVEHVEISSSASSVSTFFDALSAFPSQVYDTTDFVFVAEPGTGYLIRINQSTGAVEGGAVHGASAPVVVTGIGDQVWVVDDNGDTWVLDAKGENPVPVNLRGVEDLHLTGSDAGVVRGLASTSEGIVEFTRSATDFQSVRVVGGRHGINGVAGLSGATWFADASTNTIGWASASGQAEYAVPTADSWLSGMAVTEDRYIWSAERKTGKVVRIDTKNLDVARIGGADRYEVAQNVSRAGDYSGGDGFVFVVSGENFADALSAGPVAAAHIAPVLLTSRATLPNSTRDELIRLAPRHVVIVGGPAAVSPAVFDAISKAVPAAEVEQVGGADRYAVSRALLTGKLAHDDSPTLYVATGQNFPDALSSTPAAAHLSSSILLVNGGAASLSAEEMKVITKFSGPGKSVRIAGGTSAVSAGIEAQISQVATVQRLGGADRYAVSQAIVRDAFTGAQPSMIYLASGSNFPDALSGGVGAALKGAPVLLAHPDCVPQPVLDVIEGGSTSSVTLLGGPIALTDDVEKLTACG